MRDTPTFRLNWVTVRPMTDHPMTEFEFLQVAGTIGFVVVLLIFVLLLSRDTRR